LFSSVADEAVYQGKVHSNDVMTLSAPSHCTSIYMCKTNVLLYENGLQL